MISKDQFEQVVARANLAPSIHNAQPARWRLRGKVIEIAADTRVALPAADPDGRSVGLSCGAAVEATVLALSAMGLMAEVENLWDQADLHWWRGHRMVARVAMGESGVADGLAVRFDERFTWRGAFLDGSPKLFGWSRDDTALVLDVATRRWLAELNDNASLGILRNKAFRRELLSWMRLEGDHPRYDVDGLSREALRLPQQVVRKVRLGFGPMWPVLEMFGRTKALTAEADVTMSAPVLACFHRDAEESDVDAGRAYLRMLLEAAGMGLMAWPMAALTDDAQAAAQIVSKLAIGPERRLVQVLRFGEPSGDRTPRARRPISELIG
ncbi:MAG: hypothetical protein MUQ13_04520 [Loktanella sp.]|jgi:hypothetical protein|nr:hypothetical protein [Loktanella sp.]MDO7728537.1 hypothetical protein [Loktanella sp.]